MKRVIRAQDRWATPQTLVDAVSAYMGQPPAIDLCAGPENAKAPTFITETERHAEGQITPLEGGLFGLAPAEIAAQVGEGWAWLNPPYSRGNMAAFTAWASEYASAGGTVAVLSAAALSDGWYQKNIAPHARALLFPTSRVRFIPPAGIVASGPRGHHVVTIMGPRDPGSIPYTLFFDWEKKWRTF